jgi:hypothetical protein
MKRLFCVAVMTGAGFALRNTAQPSQSDIVQEEQTLTLVDCDGSKYTVPLDNTDASVVSDLLTQSIVSSDSNGMGALIIDMANTKKHRLQSALSNSPASASLSTILKKSSCAPDSNGVNADAILDRFGEPIPVTGQGVMDDEPSLVKRLVEKATSNLLRRDQRKYIPPPRVRMFHSDQAEVKIDDILPHQKDTLNLYQGDMVYAKNLVEVGRRGTSDVQDTVNWSPWNLWPNGQVNWYSDAAAPVDKCALATFRSAASMLEKYTCIRFRENVIPSGGINSVKLTSDGNTCWAYVGMSSQSQVNLGGPGCQIPGIALHELGHALGLIHQQSRANRDTYVTINWNNIKEAAVDNFKKIVSGSIFDNVVASKPYDYSSIMHYSVCEFSTTRFSSPCGRTLDPSDQTAAGTMGQREYLSQSDIDTINQMYGCSATCADGIQNQGEEGIDCGGPCARVCSDPSSDGILALPSECMASATTPLTQQEIYMIAGVGALVLLIVIFSIVSYNRSRTAKKDAAKQKLLANTKMTPQQLQAALRQRAARQGSAGSGNSMRPSAPPPS